MQSLELLRNQIDEVDKLLVDALNKRFCLCEAVGKYKKLSEIVSVADSAREKELMDTLSQYEMFPNMVKDIWPALLTFSKSLQK